MDSLGIALEEVMNTEGKSYALWNSVPDPVLLADMKQAALSIWDEYDNTYGYVDEKKEMMKVVDRSPRDYMLLWNMFDDTNQNKFVQRLTPQSQEQLKRIVLGE